MMNKLYYAYVIKDMASHFEERLDERKDKIKLVHSSSAVSENGEPLVYYTLEAEEGIIDSKWELK